MLEVATATMFPGQQHSDSFSVICPGTQKDKSSSNPPYVYLYSMTLSTTHLPGSCELKSSIQVNWELHILTWIF